MRSANCGIAPEGWPSILLCGLSALVFACLECWILAVLFLLLCWYSAYFFRDPERVIPQEPDVAVSPADGKLIRIERRADPFTGESCWCMSIFMNLFSVHVNRSPVAARVEEIRYFPGSFVNAAMDKASTENERCAYSLRDGDGKMWSMVQIAGLVARRIVCRVEAGDSLERGERYGLIRFGSRVDLYLPQGYSPVAQIGQQVFAGQSIVARSE